MAKKRTKASKSGKQAALPPVDAEQQRRQLLDLYQFIRDNPEFRRRIIAKMDPAQVRQLQSLWQGVKAMVKKRRACAPNKPVGPIEAT